MTMENDLVERLLALSPWHDLDWPEVVRLSDNRIQALEAALKPFAEAADSLDANDDYSSASIWEHPCALDITIGDLRRARRAARSALEEKTDV